MTKIIAFCNRKGGVGKSTSTRNIAAALQLKNKKVLVIDLDPQCSLTKSYGITDAEKNIYGALLKDYDPQPIEIVEGLDLIPSTIDLAQATIDLAPKMKREYFLKKVIDQIKDSYDYVLIDSSPSLELLTVNILVAVDEIIIPVQSEFMATEGIPELLDILDFIKIEYNPNIIVGGLFLTRYDHRKIINRTVLDYIKEEYKELVFDTKIRDNVTLTEASLSKQDIFSYNSKSFGAEDYEKLTEEIIKRHTK